MNRSAPSSFQQLPAMQPCDPSSAFFGFMGVTSALVFANLGAATGRGHPQMRAIALVVLLWIPVLVGVAAAAGAAAVLV